MIDIKTKKTAFIFATMLEAAPFIDKTGAASLTFEPFKIFNFNKKGLNFLIIISGIGKVAAVLASEHLVYKYNIDFIINAGACGGLNSDVKIGKVFKVKKVIEGDLIKVGRDVDYLLCETDVFKNLPAADLVTIDKPVFNQFSKDRLSALGSIVDMEGAAVAKAALFHNISFVLIKGVSDMADKPETFAENIAKVANMISDVLTEGI